MITFAIYEENMIVNAIISETKEDAIKAIGENIIESNNYKPWIGWTKYEDGSWRPEAPYPSWVNWDNNILEWIPPVPRPNIPCYWDENILEWIEIPSPFSSWITDGEKWIAPIPYPEDGKNYAWDELEENWILT